MDDNVVVSPPFLAGPLRLEPFRALQLDPSKVGDPASARLYARPYRGVATRVKHWIDRGDIVTDSAPALYLHEYTDDRRTIRGVVGAMDVSHRTSVRTDAVILPHEGVHPAQAAELARRMREMELNPAPILLTQRSPEATRTLLAGVRHEIPSRQYLDRGGQAHRIWAIRDPAIVSELNRSWEPTRALIADGHHRYAAYLDNQEERPGGGADLGLAMLVDQDDTPLHLGAIHRVLAGVTLADLGEAAHKLGIPVTSVDREAALVALERDVVAMSDGRRWTLMSLPLALDACAVHYIHEVLLPALDRPPRQIHYEHSVDTALARAKRGRQVALLLPAVTIDQVWRTVDAGRLLPEKATSFQPKPHPGVFIRSLHDAQPVH